MDFLIFPTTDSILWTATLPHTPDSFLRLKKFMGDYFKSMLITAEQHDKQGKQVNEHFHLWGVPRKSVTKKHISAMFKNSFPELTRVGTTGANKKSALKYLQDPIQFYYNFKNYLESRYIPTLGKLLSENQKKKYYDIYIELKTQKAIKHKFYTFVCGYHTKPSSVSQSSLIGLYIEFCIATSREPTTYDCEKKVNFCMMMKSPENLKTMFCQYFENKMQY